MNMIFEEYLVFAETVGIAFLVLVMALVIRLLPHLIAPLGIGVDHWYWKAYIEKCRIKEKFPPELPCYKLETAQWYPPLFPLILAFLPPPIFDRFSHVLAVLIDLLRAIGLMSIVYYLTRDPIAVGIAGCVYALTPLLVSYNVQLNPRGLGAIFLDLVVTLVLFKFYFNGPFRLWIVLFPFCGLMLLTHKMTTQVFWFMCLVGGVLLDTRLLLLIPMSIVSALVISRGFYWKVLQHHWDIVSYWYRNWRWAGANPIKESPLYGSQQYETPKKLHRKGIIGVIKHLYTQFGYNPFAWFMIAVLPFYPFLPIPPGGFLDFVIGWLSLTLIFSLATSLVPSLRCLGAGHLYLYNAAFPSSLLWGLLYFYWKDQYFITFVVVGTLISLLGIGRFYVHVKQSATLKIDQDFEEVLEYLRSQSTGTVMCVPPQWYDVVAYKTRLPVLYGGHGFGFKLLEPTFPRLLVTVDELIKNYNVRYFLIEPGAITEKFLLAIPKHNTREFGKYRVLSIEDSMPSQC